jgi:hypothetical protein
VSLENIFALIFTLVIYFLMALSFYGWGKLLYHLLEPSTIRPLQVKRRISFNSAGLIDASHQSSMQSIWMGWALFIFLLQVIHLFVPLNIYTTIPLFIIGIVLALYRDSNIFSFTSLTLRTNLIRSYN